MHCPETTYLSLSDAALTLKEAKCEFCRTEVQYIGYQVSSRGLEPLSEWFQPVMDTPALTCVSELKSYLGMLTYHNQLQTDVECRWTKMQQGF